MNLSTTNSITLLLVFCLIFTSVSQNNQIPKPQPFCSAPSEDLSTFIISPQQFQRQNLNQVFKGYNLHYSLEKDTPQFISLQNSQQKTQEMSANLSGIISYKLDHVQNRWSTVFTILRRLNQETMIQWGNIGQSVTNLSNTISISKNQTVTCFDSQYIKDKNVAIIDCVQKGEYENENVLFYVDLTTKTVTKEYHSQPIIDIQEIKSRKIYQYIDPNTLFHYLVRVAFSPDLTQNQDNTYVQILSINSKKFYEPETITVIDRSFLNKNTLKIMDFKIYQNLFYILDYDYGIFSVKISASQKTILEKQYTFGRKAQHFDIYQQKHENLIAAVMTSNAVYEIDLTDNSRLLNKYDYINQYQAKTIRISKTHIAVSVQFNNDDNNIIKQSILYDRLSPGIIYGAADIIIPTTSSALFIDFDPTADRLLMLTQNQISIYNIYIPNINIFPIDVSLEGQQITININAQSLDPVSQKSVICQANYNILITNKQSMKIWQSKKQFPSQHYSIYPGQLQIKLDNYATGANVNWEIKVQDKFLNNEKSSWILKQNQSYLQGLKQMKLTQISYMYQFYSDKSKVLTYVQDYQKKTVYQILCLPSIQQQVPCIFNELKFDNMKDPIALSASLQTNQAITHFFVTSTKPNVLIIYDYANTRFNFVENSEGDKFDNYMTDIQVSGNYLFVTKKYQKVIEIIDGPACAQNFGAYCLSPLFVINAQNIAKEGIKYFQPLKVQVSQKYPHIIFIQNIDSVIMITFDSHGYQVIDEISVPDSKKNWQIQLTSQYLVVVTPPSTIQQYKINKFQDKELLLERTLPIYNYQIPDTFTIRSSEQGNLLYVSAFSNSDLDDQTEQQINYQDDMIQEEDNGLAILMYQIGKPQAISLYDVYHFNNQTFYDMDDPLIFDVVSLNQFNFVTLANGDNLTVYKQYGSPYAILQGYDQDANFSISYSNQLSNKTTLNSVLKINSVSQKIQPNPVILNDTNFLTDQILYKNKPTLLEFDDFDWFIGHIGKYSITDCSDCGTKIDVINHVQELYEGDYNGEVYDAVSTFSATYLQSYSSIMVLHPNNTVKNIINIPTISQMQKCSFIDANRLGDVIVSGCYSPEYLSIYVTNIQNFKPIPRGPFYSQVNHMKKIKLQDNLLFILDSPSYSIQVPNTGVHIYSLDHEQLQSESYMPQIEFFNYLDLINARGDRLPDKVIFRDFEIIQLKGQNTYQLLLMTDKQGIFYVSMIYDNLSKEIHITGVFFVNLVQTLTQNGFTPPSNAVLNSLQISGIRLHPTTASISIQYFVAFQKFNIFKFEQKLDQNYQPIQNDVSMVLKQYGFYQNTYQMQIYGNYLAIFQDLPVYIQRNRYSERVLTFYRTQSQEKSILQNSIPVQYALGSVPQIRQLFSVFFFNHQFYNQTRVSVIDVEKYKKSVSFRINDKFYLFLDARLSPHQQPSLVVNNQFDSYKLGFKIPGLLYKRVKGPRGYMIRKVKQITQPNDIYQQTKQHLIQQRIGAY